VTAFASRRRRSTLLAAGAAVVAIVVAGGLTVAGGVALYNSTDGASVGPLVPELVFPNTRTALLAAVDDGGTLASLAVLVVRPDGVGGSMVPVPVSADASSGEGDERLPIAESVALEGPEVLEREVGIALSLSFDTVEVADVSRLAELLAPVGDVEVELPDEVTDADGAVVADKGTATLTPAELAAVLTARDPDVPAGEQYDAAAAVWAGVASTVADGLAAGEPAAAAAGSVQREFDQISSGPVQSRALARRPIEAERNPREVDVVLLDRAELALVFGQITPGRVSAPNNALSFRVVASFSAAQLGDRGWTNAEVAYRAVNQVLFLRGNVISVDTTAAEAPRRTRLELSDATLNTRGVREVFGDVVLDEPAARLVGVDGILVLGTEYLAFLDDLDVLPGETLSTSEVEGRPIDDVEPVTPGGGTASTTKATTDITKPTDNDDTAPESAATGG